MDRHRATVGDRASFVSGSGGKAFVAVVKPADLRKHAGHEQPQATGIALIL
ncbi:MAG: hypothetical protein WBQ86_05345 [Candidatus Binatus sp.]